jgi:hypothetical protein
MKNSQACRQTHRTFAARPMSWLFVLTGLLVLPFSVEKSAAQAPTFTIGFRSWFSNWNVQQPVGARVNVDPSLLIGPTATVRLGKVSLGASYLFGTFGSVYSIPEGDFDVDFKRKDVDLYVGYRLLKNVNATLGYKRFTYTARYGGEDLAEVNSNGFGGGLTFSRSFDGGLVLSSSVNLMRMSTTFMQLGNEVGHENDLGYNAEANIGYRIRPNLPIPFIGYRIQSLSGDYEDRFSGVTLWMLYQL